MKLTNYILDLGRAVAYYPGLVRVTGSITATVMLCQFLYWSDKTRDNGWIYKNSDEIQEETGLTYNEQKTAKIALEDLRLIDYEVKRLDHTTRYRINQDELNRQWEELIGKKSKAVEKPVKEERTIEDEFRKPQQEETRRTDAVKKGDIVDGILEYAKSPAMKKENEMDVIREKLKLRLRINPDGKKWETFIEYCHTREFKHEEPTDKFISWAITNGWNPIYWTPDKMRTMWPQAFTEEEVAKPREDFVQALPKHETKEYAPMPREAKARRD